MYRVSTCPIPNGMRADLERVAAFDAGQLRIAAVWAFKALGVVAVLGAALYAVDTIVASLAGDAIRQCAVRREPFSILAIPSWIVGAVGLAAAGLSQLYRLEMKEQARLARLELDSGQCERIDVEIPEQHIFIADEDFIALLLPEGKSKTAVLTIFYDGGDNGCGVEKLFNKDTYQPAWSWKKGKHIRGVWEIEASGEPLQLREPVSCDTGWLDEVIPDLKPDPVVVDIPFERVLELSRKKQKRKENRAAAPTSAQSDGALQKAAPARII